MSFFHKSGNLPRVTDVFKTKLGLTLVQPSQEVLAIIDSMTPRELNFLDSIATVEGMQELLRTRSIRAEINEAMHLCALFIVDASELEQEIKEERSRVKVMHVETTSYTPTKPVVREPIVVPATETSNAAVSDTGQDQIPGLEHLTNFEHMCGPFVDFLVKHGQLNSGDKDVLKKIRPSASTAEARVVALERWQAELTRRLRSIHVAKVQQMVLGADNPEAEKRPLEEVLVHRFDALMAWLSKLIKAVEALGYRYHEKPMWLPH